MKAFLNWSGGKDSALCLHKALQEGLNIEALVTTINNSTNRISMHGVRRSLLEQQAAALQLPLYTVELPEQPGMAEYEQAISRVNRMLKLKGFTHAVSGDLFLEDLRSYREKLYAKDEVECLFPLWETDTKELLRSFFSSGFKATIICVNSSFLDKSFCGRSLDESFINDLPATVDTCGENGEYHSFVFEGPLFSQPIQFKKGELIFKEYPSPVSQKDACFSSPQTSTGFYFCDLIA
jgi:uncharacterized protein (TIGR00290 family)